MDTNASQPRALEHAAPLATIRKPSPQRDYDEPRSWHDITLYRAAALFGIAIILHNSDHLRRGVEEAPTDVLVVGLSSILLEVALVVLVYQRHRLAPLAAAVGGGQLAVGYFVVHLSPARSVLSDSLLNGPEVDLFSWAAVLIEVAAAVTLTAAGIAALRARGGLTSATRPHAGQLRLAAAVRQPIPMLVLVTHAVGYLVGFAQLAF